MPAPETLRAQTGPEDGALFEVGLKNSFFLPQPHNAYTDDVEEKLPITLGTLSLGREFKFDVEKDATLLRDLDFVFTPPALAVPGDGTYIRYCDWLPLALVESVEWKYGGNSIQRYDTQDIVYSNIRYFSDECKSIWRYLMMGDTSAAERNTYAAAPDRPLRCMIPSPWKWIDCHSPLIAGLANKLTVHIRLRTPREVIQTDGTKPTSLDISNSYIDKRVMHFNGLTRGEYVGLTNTPEGVSYLYDDIQLSKFVIPAGALGSRPYAIELRDLDGPVSRIDFIIRTTAQIDPTTADVDIYDIDTDIHRGLSHAIVSNTMNIDDEELVKADE